MRAKDQTSLQQRVPGVPPARIDVSHAGNSYHFVRPLVLDEETRVTLNSAVPNCPTKVV